MAIDILSLVRELNGTVEPEVQDTEKKLEEKAKNEDVINYLSNKISSSTPIFTESDFELLEKLVSEEKLSLYDIVSDDKFKNSVDGQFRLMKFREQFQNELQKYKETKRTMERSYSIEDKIHREVSGYASYSKNSEDTSETVFI